VNDNKKKQKNLAPDVTDDGHNGRSMSLHGSTQVVKQISAVPDEPLDAVCHEQRVINEGGRSV